MSRNNKIRNKGDESSGSWRTFHFSLDCYTLADWLRELQLVSSFLHNSG